MWGIGNQLIQDYGHTNYRVVFDVVAGDLPDLAKPVAQHLAGQ